MTQEEINKAFEGRWRIKSQYLDKALEAMLIEYRVDYVKKLCRDFFEAGILIASTGTGSCCHAQVPVPNEEPDEESFNKWWELYDKKCGRKDCLAKWKRLSYGEKKACFLATPAYVATTPDKQYRKNPLTYLNQKAWNDEIINRNGNSTNNNLDKLAKILAT